MIRNQGSRHLQGYVFPSEHNRLPDDRMSAVHELAEWQATCTPQDDLILRFLTNTPRIYGFPVNIWGIPVALLELYGLYVRGQYTPFSPWTA